MAKPTLKDVAQYFDLTDESKMAAKLNIKAPISTHALLEAFRKQKPVAKFTVDVHQGNLPLTVHFTDLSKGYITEYQWDFDDQTFSNEQNPVHVYHVTNCGAFFPALTVKNAVAQDKSNELLQVFVIPPEPDIRIGANPISGPAPLKVQFTDESKVACFLDRLWDFGDGQSSTEANPTHTFDNPSTTDAIVIQVKLLVHNPGGTGVTAVNIQVGPQKPTPPPSNQPQGEAPYVHVDVDWNMETVVVHGARFKPNTNITINFSDGVNPSFNLPAHSDGLGTFNTDPIGIAGCNGQAHNILKVKASDDGGATYSGSYQVSC